MSHVDGFDIFFRLRGHGEAADICQYLNDQGVHFKCNEDRKITSVRSQLNRQCRNKKRYSTGVISRVKNGAGIYEYFTN